MSCRRPSRRPLALPAVLACALAGAGLLAAADGDPLGPHGLAAFDAGGTDADAARALAVLPDGRIVLAGTVATGAGTYALALARFHAAGNLDASFGLSGQVVDPFGFGAIGAIGTSGAALVRLADGRLLVAGSVDYGGGDQDFYVGRLLESGAPDPTFGPVGSGTVTIPFDQGGDFTDALAALALDRSGRILVAGSVDVSASDSDLAVARLSADGQLDTSFSGDGRLTVSASPTGSDLGLALAVHPAGGVVVAGAAWATDLGGHFAIALARVLADGALDGGFGTGGVEVFPWAAGGTNNAIAWGLGIWPDGEIVVAGDLATAANEWKWALFRFSTVGQYVNGVVGSFCASGSPPCPAMAQDSPRGLLLQGDGKIVFAGFGLGTSGGTDFGVGRLTRELYPDFDFGDTGMALYDFAWGPGAHADAGAALALDQDGRIVVAGAAEYNGFDTDFAWVRFDSSYIFADGFDQGDGAARWSTVVH